MILNREHIEAREKETLAPYAAFSCESRGRKHSEEADLYRTCFQRDRDRVIHSKAFRRLRGKTQVFIAGFGDHYRSRLAHSLEVAQLARDIARTLALNEDLTESIALAHDLGHTPFGHAGQEEMNAIMEEYGGRFEHNEQSRRVVEFFEEKFPDFPGLNLSFEVTDGLIKHRTPYDHPPVTDTLMPSLEAQVVNLADEIAYLAHDIDDGLRSGILKVTDPEHLSIWRYVQPQVDQNLPVGLLVSSTISALITAMVNDLTEHTNRLIKKQGIKTIQDVNKTKTPLAGFTNNMRGHADELKDFLYKNFYQSQGVSEYNEKGREIIRVLFKKMMEDAKRLPEKFRAQLNSEEPPVVVKDYIAGMTDQFALDLFRKLL